MLDFLAERLKENQCVDNMLGQIEYLPRGVVNINFDIFAAQLIYASAS